MAVVALPAAGIAATRRTESIQKETARAGDAPTGGVLYFVNTTSDVVVAGACANGEAGCSLRGAIQAANSHVGDDGIELDLPAGSVINLTAALPDLTEGVSIAGLGANLVTVRRDSGGEYRIFTVTVQAPGVVTFSGLTVSNGLSTVPAGIGAGGGIANSSSGAVNVTNSTISGNTSTGDFGGFGGGICNSTIGTVSVTNSSLSGNTAAEGLGGGIANLSIGIVNVTNSTISGNQAREGGGIHIYNGTLNVTNCTLSGNSAIGSLGFGGGFGNNNGTVNVTNSTISGNTSAGGGGGFGSVGSGTGSGTVNVKTSIIALNTGASAAPEVSGIVASGGFNLIGKTDGSKGFTAPTDQTGTAASPIDPRLDPAGLQENGGPTQTIALLFGSPAIDKGIANSLTTDQRGTGFPRIFDDSAIPNATGGDGTDIGSFELQTAAPTTLANISTRLRVETDDNVLIGGFIITGTQAKKVIVRAIGPSLPVAGALADPILELRNSSGALIASNDNWRSHQEAEIIATGIPPSHNSESAIVAILPASGSAYTAIVRGVNNGTGIGVVEAYDLNQTVDSRLANIATRGLVQTGDNVLIAGTIVLGSASQRVLVRAIGPSLPVPGKLANPTLELRDGNGGVIRANDNWRSDQEAEIIATTIPPADDFESAIIETLLGNGAAYTAIVRGVNSTTGVAVVEVYALN